MVDFAKLKADNKARLAGLATATTVIKKAAPTYLDRINHLIAYHLGELTEWEANFCYSNKQYLSEFKLNREREDNVVDFEIAITPKVKAKIKELEDTYCGSMCHALNNAGVNHG
jgi:hypothetical protein